MITKERLEEIRDELQRGGHSPKLYWELFRELEESIYALEALMNDFTKYLNKS